MHPGGDILKAVQLCLLLLLVVANACFGGDESRPKQTIPSTQSVMPEESTLQWASRILQSLGYSREYFRRLHTIVAAEYSTRVMDANLWSYWGYHQIPEHKHYQMRTWVPVPVSQINPAEVDGIRPELFATYARVAMEIEDPIMLYSIQSGAGFRKLLPGLGRFMGRDPESVAFAKENNLHWCDSAWCAEEDRHGNALARIFRQLIGQDPARDNPAPGEEAIETIDYALKHVDSRQSAEWTASGTYLTLLAHSHGNLHNHLRNVFRDEVKHLSIMSAVDRYLRGPQPWRRFRGMFEILWERVKAHRNERSGADSGIAEPVFFMEILYAHMLNEVYTRRWLSTLPYPILRKIFETPSRLPDSAKATPDAATLARWEEDKRLASQLRTELTWWTPKAREEELAQWNWTQKHAVALDALIAQLFQGFRGAEEPGSVEDQAVRNRIDLLAPGDLRPHLVTRDMYPVRRALRDALRGYQIENNFQTRVFRGELEPDPEWFNVKSPKNYRFACAEAVAEAK